MSRVEVEEALASVETSLDANDVVDARLRLGWLGDRFPCFEEPMDRSLFALYARYVSLSWFYKQDEEQTRRWALASRWADPALPWDAVRFPREHPLRVWTEAAPMPPIGNGAGKHFVVPEGGGVVVAGQLLSRPEVPAELPVVVQVFDGDGLLVSGFWQDGNAFPESMVADGVGDLPAPAWWWRPPGPPVVLHRGPEIPVLPVVAGSSLLVASAVTYALAGGAASSMAELDTGPELTAARTRANALVLCSALALAGGVGVGVGGVLFDARGVTVRF